MFQYVKVGDERMEKRKQRQRSCGVKKLGFTKYNRELKSNPKAAII